MFVYYRKLNEITRPYILSLITLDLPLGMVTLISFVVVIASKSMHVSVLAYKVYSISFVFGFGLYHYPSFFLACDRFLAVIFPLKYNDHCVKLRVTKIVFFSINFINQFSVIVFNAMYGFEHALVRLTTLVSVFCNIFVTLATFFLYFIMVVQIIRSSRKMAKSQAKENSTR